MTHVDKRVVAEFQRRRKRMLVSFGFTLTLFTLGLILLQLTDQWPALMGISHRGWKGAAIAQMISGVIIAAAGFYQYRCPVCKNILRGHDIYYLGVTLDPDKCPTCGTALRE